MVNFVVSEIDDSHNEVSMLAAVVVKTIFDVIRESVGSDFVAVSAAVFVRGADVNVDMVVDR